MAEEFDFDATLAMSSIADIRGGLEGLNFSADRFARTMTRAFASAALSGRSFEATLKSIGASLANMALTSGLRPLQQGFGSLLGSLFASFGGASGMSGVVTPFAEGGIVSRPVFFGSGSGLGLMGERGAEAIMPLARGPDGRLGLAMPQARQGATINVNIATPDVQGFARSQGQISAAIARAVVRGQRNL